MGTIKSVRVYDLDLRFGSRTHVAFSQPDEDRPGRTTSEIYLLRSDWEEFGSPERMTVTLQPGDVLNPDSP